MKTTNKIKYIKYIFKNRINKNLWILKNHSKLSENFKRSKHNTELMAAVIYTSIEQLKETKRAKNIRYM